MWPLSFSGKDLSYAIGFFQLESREQRWSKGDGTRSTYSLLFWHIYLSQFFFDYRTLRFVSWSSQTGRSQCWFCVFLSCPLLLCPTIGRALISQHCSLVPCPRIIKNKNPPPYNFCYSSCLLRVHDFLLFPRLFSYPFFFSDSSIYMRDFPLFPPISAGLYDFS